MNTHHDTWIALLPQLISTLLVMALLAQIALRRCVRTAATITVLGLVAALAALPCAWAVVPQAATGLFIVDGHALFYAGLVLAAALGATLLLWNYLDQAEGNREEMFLLLALSVNGALVLVTARHMAAFFIGLELMTVPLYGMLGYLFMQRRSLESATKYLVLSAAATSFLLMGMAFLYAHTGRLDFSGIAVSFATGYFADAWLAQAGLAMLLVGIAFKLSLAPFHQWTLDVYEGAPAPVGAFLATVGKIAVVAVLLRLLQEGGVFGTFGLYPSGPAWGLLGVLVLIAALSILVGNLLALRQENLKRLLAASSIAHFGYLLIAVIAGSTLGNEAAAMYLCAYVATTIGAFGVITLLPRTAEGRDGDMLGNLRGLSTRAPFLAFALTVMFLSLAGIPLTAGFLGKFYVIAAGAGAGLWWLLVLLVVGSAIGLWYYLRVIATLYQSDGYQRDGQEEKLSVPAVGTLAVAIALVVVLLVGIWPEPVSQALTQATLVRLP